MEGGRDIMCVYAYIHKYVYTCMCIYIYTIHLRAFILQLSVSQKPEVFPNGEVQHVGGAAAQICV